MESERKGFTLVELLIVVAIIGLLVAMVLPSLGRAKAFARRTSCGANLHAVGVAFRMYLHYSNDIMPVAAQMPSLGLNDDPPIAEVLAPYLSVPEVLKCPADVEKDYFASEGSSYEYNSLLGGRGMGKSFLTRRWGESKTPIMWDYEPFHGPAGESGAANYLFADSHVGDLE